MDKLLEEAKELLYWRNKQTDTNQFYTKEAYYEVVDLITRLVERIEGMGWQLIKINKCGCEIRKSNKGHYFADSCDICSNLPLPPIGDK